MTDIYLVTSGEYSSYSVDAAFSTVEAADTWAERMNLNNPRATYYGREDRYTVERVDLDPPLPELVKRIVELTEPTTAWVEAEEQKRELIDSIKIPLDYSTSIEEKEQQ